MPSSPLPASSEVRLVFIGAGPAALMLLERIVAGHAADPQAPPLRIDLVDPHEPGGGRIWRRDQSPLLKLNTLVGDAAVFTDASCTIDGPIAPGPSLVEWLERLLAGDIPRPGWWDDLLEDEARQVTEHSFPTRRLHSAYLSWAYEEVVRRAGPGVRIDWHRDRAVAVSSYGDAHVVTLAAAPPLTADVVVYLLGHNGSAPAADSAALAEFAASHDLVYVPPAFTAEADLSWVCDGEDVIVRGLGLAAVDLMVLLAEGRGGRFERHDGELRYVPSGREPVLHLGSRRGVPYRSKVTSRLAGDPVVLVHLGEEFRARVAGSEHPLDFDRDVWPLFVAELITGYYRELFTGHPDRVSRPWSAFGPDLARVLAQPDGFRSDACRALVEQGVPHAEDRFDFEVFDRPLDHADELGAPRRGDLAAADAETQAQAEAEALQQRVRDHIALDLRLRTEQRHSAAQGLFLTALFAHQSLAEIPKARWTARSRCEGLPRRLHAFFSYLASGPPAHRLEEILALSRAGVVRFLGAHVEVRADEATGLFSARGRAQTPGGRVEARVTARALVDAWLPHADAARSDNGLLRRLVADGVVHELVASDEGYTGGTGQVETGVDGRLPGAPGQFAVGAFTSAFSGAFTRPGIDSLPFRRFDRIARAVLDEARVVAAAAPREGAVAPAAERLEVVPR